MAESKTGNYCYYLPELFAVRSIVRHQEYRIVGLTSNKRYVVPLTQLQLPNIVDRAEISVTRDASEIRGTSKEDWQQRNAGNCRHSDRRGAPAVKTWKSKVKWSIAWDQTLLESPGVLQEAGWKIEERVGGGYECSRNKDKSRYRTVDERECLAREFENAEIVIRKLRTRVRTEQTSKKVIQRSLEAINAQSLFSRPPNFYEILFLPQGATTSTIQKLFIMLAMLCQPDKCRREDLFKNFLFLWEKNYWRRGGP